MSDVSVQATCGTARVVGRVPQGTASQCSKTGTSSVCIGTGAICAARQRPNASRYSRERHVWGLLYRVELLKHQLELARDLVWTESNTPPDGNEDRGKAALTELSQRIETRHPFWSSVWSARSRRSSDSCAFQAVSKQPRIDHEVMIALGKNLLKYWSLQDADLFENARGFILQYH